MKAIVYRKYGPPDVLQFSEVEKPTPRDNEVLVKVHAAAVNPADWHFIRGTPAVMRLASGLLRPKNKTPGADIAGRVEAVGGSAKRFKPGDEVYGDLAARGFGAFAEYVSVREDAVAPKPANLSFEEAAAVPLAAVTALQGLRDKGGIQQGQKVLINGASGGVGTFAVQIAKSYGAEVTGVCSARNADLVRSLGAAHIIDYTKEDFTQSGVAYDLIIDTVGNHSVSELKRVPSRDGKCVVIGFSSPATMIGVMLKGGKKVRTMMARANKDDLAFLTKLLEAGIIVPVIDKRYPLVEMADAIRYLEEGHARGKVVIEVAKSDKGRASRRRRGKTN